MMLQQPASSVPGPAPESAIAKDMVKRAAIVGHGFVKVTVSAEKQEG